MKYIIVLLLLCSPVYAENFRAKIGTDIAKVLMRGEDSSPVVSGPHPDVNKCICKGTGIIKQGDGHSTECPYHGKKGQMGDGCVCGDNCECDDCPFSCLEGKEMISSVQKKSTMRTKYVLYHLGADWCGPCERMLRDVYTNRKLRDYLESNDIQLYKFDHTKAEHKKYFNYYSVGAETNKKFPSRGFPTLMIAKRNNLNNPISIDAGYKSVDGLIRFIEGAIK